MKGKGTTRRGQFDGVGREGRAMPRAPTAHALLGGEATVNGTPPPLTDGTMRGTATRTVKSTE